MVIEMSNPEPNFSLSSSIFSKLQSEIPPLVPEKNQQDEEDGRLQEIYSKVGLLLSRYKSGKLPKAFKVIPTLQNWEKVLLMTNPDGWTSNATYEATRIFVSNLSPKMAQRFLEFILLPKLRQDIATSKRVDTHLYAALKKSVYKPAALFKGIILPLCDSEDLTLKEATIISSVLVKVSVPVLHSAAALFKILGLPYNGGRSIFVRTLLDKKYALPSTLIKRLLSYFESFKSVDEELPVLWHQSLLVFCQRYKLELSEEEKKSVLELVQIKRHCQISAEVEREFGLLPDTDMNA